VKTVYIYGTDGKLLSEADGTTGKVLRDYVLLDGLAFAVLQDNKVYYIHPDHLTAPLLVTDANKNIVWKASYNPFGRASMEVEQIKLNLRADGQYADEETGLYYNWNRYYNPELGRYITSDPLGLQAGVNTYIYVNGNPINYTDPFGLWGVGGLYNGTMEGGFASIGYGSNTSVGGGLFFNATGASVGTFSSNGTLVRVPKGIALQYPSTANTTGLKALNQVNGAYAGWGPGAYITNANCAADLAGAGDAYSINIPFASFSLGVSGNTWVIAVTVGASAGMSVSSYPTNTNTAELYKKRYQ